MFVILTVMSLFYLSITSVWNTSVISFLETADTGMQFNQFLTKASVMWIITNSIGSLMYDSSTSWVFISVLSGPLFMNYCNFHLPTYI